MMEDKGKVRKGFYIEEDLLEQMDGLLEQADESCIEVLYRLSDIRENRKLYAFHYFLSDAFHSERQREPNGSCDV